ARRLVCSPPGSLRSRFAQQLLQSRQHLPASPTLTVFPCPVRMKWRFPHPGRTPAMKISYFQTFRNESQLAGIPPLPALPGGFSFVTWSDTLLAAHAEVKCRCFHDELDAAVFPNLATREGCLQLMTSIRQKSGFVPEATWLIACDSGYCATVQG